MSIKKITAGGYAMKVLWNIWQTGEHPLCTAIQEAYEKGIDPDKVIIPMEKAAPIPQKTATKKPAIKKQTKTLLARTFTYQGVKNIPVEVKHECQVKSLEVFIHESLPQLSELVTRRHNSKKNKKYSVREKKTGELLLTASTIKKACEELRRQIIFLNPYWRERPVINGGKPKMTRRERKERKLEKRLEWAESREKKADQSMDAANNLVKNIPPGQPILVGHHSEKRHRNTLKRSNNLMHKSIEHSDMAEHHRNKADNLKRQLNNTIFSDDPDAIERLQKKLEYLEKGRNRMKEINIALRKGQKIELSEDEKKALESNKRVWNAYSFMPYELSNVGQRIRSIKKRIEKLTKC